MGNLAERYGDSSRSGLYRVTCPEVPLRAALEADAIVLECLAEHLELRWMSLKYSIELGDKRARVLIIHDAGVLASPTLRQWNLLSKLLTIAKSARRSFIPLFVVFVDPMSDLQLPSLWNERVEIQRENEALEAVGAVLDD